MTSSRAWSPERQWLAVTALYVGLALIYCWPLLLSINSGLPNDTGDPGLIAWGLWWNAHAVPFTDRWWNAPIFFPMKGAFALSDTFLGLAPLTTPLQWAGFSAVATYNLTFLVSIPTAAIAAHALARRQTGRHDVALIAGLAFGFSPYRASQMPHLQLLVTCWMPLALLALHRYVDTHRRRDLVLFGCCWLLNGLISGYYLVFFTGFVGLWMLWFVRSWREWLAIGVTGAIAALPVLPILHGYSRVQNLLGLSRDVGQIQSYSADLSGLAIVSAHDWLPYHWSLPSRPESEIYPGLVVVALSAVAAIAGWRALPRVMRGRVQVCAFWLGVALIAIATAAVAAGGFDMKIAGVHLAMTRPFKTVSVAFWCFFVAIATDRRVVILWRRRSVLAFYTLGAIVTLVLALGPVAQAFDQRFLYLAPYSWLMRLPGGQSIRVPARFAMLMVLCLSQTAALAAMRFRAPRARWIAIVSVLILLDGWVPKLPMAPTTQMVTLSGLAGPTPVLELPMRDLYDDTQAMLRSTSHGHPLVNGYSGYEPSYYAPLREGAVAFDPAVLSALQQFGPLAVLVNHANDADGKVAAFVGGAPGAVLAYTTPVGPLFRFDARPPARADISLDVIHPLRIVDNAGVDLTHIVSDGNLESRWRTKDTQAVGDSIVIAFDRPEEVGRVEIDLGGFTMDYPHRLRVSADRDNGVPQAIWEGNLAGLALLGAFADPHAAPLRFDLPRYAPSARLTLTLTASDSTFYWSISELRLFRRAATDSGE